MTDEGSATRSSRVKREMALSGNDNNHNGSSSAQSHYAAAAASALAKGEKRSNVAGFLAKAYQIFDNPTWSDICGWGQGGETVVIRKQIDFAQKILPLFFSHSNLQSFVRQLNMYNFRKVVQDPNSGEFKHDLFRQGNEHLLHKIKRKQSAGAAASSSALPQSGKYRVEAAGLVSGPARVAGGIVQEADNVLDELVKLRKWKEDMEKTVVELKRDKQTLQSENQMLKGQVEEHTEQQMVLQSKMQKILFCMYDAYVAGLPALTASGEAEGEGQGQHSAGNGVAKVKTESLVAAGAMANGSSAASALEKALQQLATLAGENMSSKINLLDMENPWTLGGAEGTGFAGGSGGGYAAGVADGTGPTATAVFDANGTNAEASGNSSSSSNGNVVGGGSLKRNRTWSRTSYEWLRSLRDPDPLDTIGSPGSSSPAAQVQARAGAEAGGSGTPGGQTSAAGDFGFSAGVSNGGGATNGSSNHGSAVDATAASVTPDRGPSSKRQRLSTPPKAEVAGGGGGGGSAVATPSSFSLLPPPPPVAAAVDASAPATSAATADAAGAEAEAACASADKAFESWRGKESSDPSPSGGGGGSAGTCSAMQKTLSFQPNAPLAKDSSLSSIVDRADAETERRAVAAAGGDAGSGEIWGGGALSRKMSEGATQVVSELGELGHREGEALTKIDSLGYQLANLLDPNIAFDEMPMFDDEGDPFVPEGGITGDTTSTAATDGPGLEGMATSDDTAGVGGEGVDEDGNGDDGGGAGLSDTVPA